MCSAGPASSHYPYRTYRTDRRSVGGCSRRTDSSPLSDGHVVSAVVLSVTPHSAVSLMVTESTRSSSQPSLIDYL